MRQIGKSKTLAAILLLKSYMDGLITKEEAEKQWNEAWGEPFFKEEDHGKET